jgi:hypothetical protein
MTNPAQELCDLVQQLAHRHETVVIRHGQRIGHREQKPLLTLLAEASVPTLSSAGRGGPIGPRLTFDPAASELHTAIRARIRHWAEAAHVPRHWSFATAHPVDWRDAAQLLNSWHARTLHTDPYTWIPTLHGWVTTITSLVIDPPDRFAVDAECPDCRHRWAIDQDGLRVDALQVTVNDATDAITLCRNCGAHWAGLDGAEHLAELLRSA